VQQQFDWLFKEAQRDGGRIFTLALHPWCIGQPHRIAALERIVRHITSHTGVWAATGSELLAAFHAQKA
jgi:allantoinase